jgi:hypothetical protein
MTALPSGVGAFIGWATRHRVWLSLAGALIFAAVLQARYQSIPADFYGYRDDGIITLSHARNWIDFGFIGVNPSGERLEAASAPLQFLLYAAAYAIGSMSYQTFMDAQTLLCTLAIGALLPLFFVARPVFALGATAFIALFVTEFPAFLVWHASGMENALTHVLLAATVLLLYRAASSRRIERSAAVLAFAASITRVDGIYHVFPLLLVFWLYWEGRVRDRRARTLVFDFLLMWVAFNLARFAYFGAVMPNTAVAQGISVGDRVIELVRLSPVYLDQSFSLARANFSRLGGYLLVLALPFILLRQRDADSTFLLTLIGCAVLTCVFAPFIFGPARLDAARTTTQMALFVPLFVAAAASAWEARRVDAYSLPVVALLAVLLHEYNRGTPTEACCSPRLFDPTRVAFVHAARENGITRPTVASPDLGVLSWYKQANVVDLGSLGSSVIARVDLGPRLNRYLFDYAAPDMIESHGYWSCRYSTFFADRRFRAAYVELGPPGSQWSSCNGVQVAIGIWIRRDVMAGSASAERALLESLQRMPSIQRVASELRQCEQSNTAPAACAYVARSVYRLLPEFRARGEQQALEDLFATSRSRVFDLYLIRGAREPGAWRPAVEELNTGESPGS